MSATDFTPNLTLPYLLPNQAQKHVTMNESLAAIDTLLMTAVQGVAADTPPTDPQDGAAWLLSATPNGDWAGQGGDLASWRDGVWHFLTPQAGWHVFDVSDGALKLFDGTQWTPIGIDTQNLSRIGLATEADAANPFAARLNAALWTARETGDGGSGDVRLNLNKQAGANVASLVFQSAYSGRAEFGLAGSDNFSVRVSPNGTVWQDAISVDRTLANVGIGGPAGASDRPTVHGRFQAVSSEGYFLLRDNGTLDVARNGGGTIYIRARSNGSTLNFGATTSAGVLNNSVISIRPDQGDILCNFALSPTTNAGSDLGQANRVWRDLYIQNAPTVSSDRRGKCQIDDLQDAPALIDFLRPVTFRRDAEGPRHFGFIAQEVRDALQAIGYTDAALWCLSDPDDDKSVQALRQEELIAVLVAAVQSLTLRIEQIEAQSEGRG